MSSQDSEGESYVADYIASLKVYGDVEHYGWTTEEEEDYDPKGKEETSSDEDEVPLPPTWGHARGIQEVKSS
jgi:hypothetical protein